MTVMMLPSEPRRATVKLQPVLHAVNRGVSAAQSVRLGPVPQPAGPGMATGEAGTTCTKTWRERDRQTDRQTDRLRQTD